MWLRERRISSSFSRIFPDGMRIVAPIKVSFGIQIRSDWSNCIVVEPSVSVAVAEKQPWIYHISNNSPLIGLQNSGKFV